VHSYCDKELSFRLTSERVLRSLLALLFVLVVFFLWASLFESPMASAKPRNDGADTGASSGISSEGKPAKESAPVRAVGQVAGRAAAQPAHASQPELNGARNTAQPDRSPATNAEPRKALDSALAPGAESDPVRKTTSPVMEEIKPVTGAAKDAAEPVEGVAKDTLEPVAGTARQSVEPMRGVAKDTLEPVSNTVEPVVPTVNKTVEPVVGAVEPVTTSTIKTVQPVVDATKPIVAPVIDVAKPVSEPVTEMVTPVLDAVEPVVRAVEPLATPVSEVTEPVVGLSPVQVTPEPAKGSYYSPSPEPVAVPAAATREPTFKPEASVWDSPLTEPLAFNPVLKAANTATEQPLYLEEMVSLGKGVPPSSLELVETPATSSLPASSALPLETAEKDTVQDADLSVYSATERKALEATSLPERTLIADEHFLKAALSSALAAVEGSLSQTPLPSSPGGAAPAGVVGSSGASASAFGGAGLAMLAVLLALSSIGGRFLKTSREFLRPDSALLLAAERPG
jgi:hypothetical protein